MWYSRWVAEMSSCHIGRAAVHHSHTRPYTQTNKQTATDGTNESLHRHRHETMAIYYTIAARWSFVRWVFLILFFTIALLPPSASLIRFIPVQCILCIYVCA